MKYLLSVFIAIFLSFQMFSQEKEMKPFSVDADFFYGTIIEHNPDIAHLITGHPTGFILRYNRKTYGLNEWERRYNYPDWGFSVAYQNLHEEHLGQVFSAYGHYNWYFFKRNLVFTLGQGIAYNDNPYDRETNDYNSAYGTHILSSTYFKLGYVKENLWKGLGVFAGLSFIHYSNGNLRAPNTSTNTLAANVGLSYQFDQENFPEYIVADDPLGSSYAQPLKFNFVFRMGANESDVIGLGQHPFYVFSSYVDKRISFKSSFQAGVDFFVLPFQKDLIEYRSIAYPEDGLSGDEDYKRLGIFVGYELRLNRNAIGAQLGYYAYFPYEFENRVYNRLALKRYFFDDRFFAVISVKSHWAKAEGIEFGIGVRI